MLVIQHNCRKTYAITIAALETGLKLNAAFICLQEPYIGPNQHISHPGYTLYWPEAGEHKNKRVTIAVRRDLITQLIIEARTVLIDHPYALAIDIWDLQQDTRTRKRRTRLINIYDNRIGLGTCYQSDANRSWRAIEDITWNTLLRGRAVLLGDFNAHSPAWNPLISRRIDAGPLEQLIKDYNLILNNEPGAITRPGKDNRGSIIDLTFTTEELGPLELWAIETEWPTPSDHELIVLEWTDIDNIPIIPNKGEITGWDIDKLKQDPETYEKAKEKWRYLALYRPIIDYNSQKEDLESEAIWIEESLTKILNQFAKPLRITAFSKRWWNSEIQEARSHYAKARRDFKLICGDNTEVNRARNDYYITVRKAKRKCWQDFLQGVIEDDSISLDNQRCWTALKYTSPRALSTTPTVKGNSGEVAITLEQKEELFLASQFPKAHGNELSEPIIPQDGGIELITDQVIQNALLSQSIKKAPGLDRLNFKAIRLLWEWDQERIIALIRHCFRLGYQPNRWKIAKGIIIRKPNKSNYILAKHYRTISLLNCLGKVVEKVAAEILSKRCERLELLHNGQFGSRKSRGAIDAIAKLIATVEHAWKHKKIAGALFLDVKGAYPNVIRQQLIKRLVELGIPGDLIRWVNSFLTDRKVQLVIDGYTCPVRDIEIGVPQGSPISPILFIIYISGFFDAIEAKIPIISLSFADDIGLIAIESSIREVTKTLEQAGEEAINWGLQNSISFEVDKTEAVLFTKKRKLAKEANQARIRLANERIRYNKEATKWLGVWLDSGLSFKTHYQTRLQKAKAAENRLRSISSTYGLSPGLVRRVQIAAVQSVALYGAEIWWQGQKAWADDLQRLINRQARTITGTLKTTPIGPLIKEAALTPAVPLLDDRQRRYALRALKLPTAHPINELLPPTLRYGDGDAQPGQYSNNNLEWVEPDSDPKSIGQRLAKKLTLGLDIDPSEGCEIARTPKDQVFPGNIVIKPKDIAETEARNIYNAHNAALELVIWSDGSKLDTGGVGAGITWKRDNIWRQKGYPLGSTKEVFDAELYGIRNALDIAIKGGQLLKRSLQLARYPYNRVIVLSDSQAALQRAQNDQLGPGQTLAIEIIAKAQLLRDEGAEVTLQWVPSHIGIEGNERADKIAKEAASKPIPPGVDRYSSFSYIMRQVKAQKRLETRNWLYKVTYKGEIKKRNRAYTLTEPLELEPQVSTVRKPLAKRFYQLKIGHAITASYLHRIKRSNTPRCWWCNTAKQDIDHLLFECRRWSPQRRALYSDLRRLGITTPRMSEERPKNRLFNTPKAIKPILDFLNATNIGQRPKESEEEEENWDRLDRWDLDRLDSEEPGMTN